jgi:copper transport protein
LSATGIGLAASIVLAVTSLWIVGRSKWIDFVWVALLMLAEAINGHAAAFPPVILSIAVDFIHLVTSAIWAGGLLYLIYFWKTEKAHAERFLPVFSKAALVSLILLIVTGTLSTLIYLPGIQEITYTWWGRLLLLKTLLVAGVVVTGAFIRKAMKMNARENLASRIKVDFVMMIAILVIVGVFTSLNPITANEPLVWRANESDLSVVTKITPNRPGGGNVFTVKIQSRQQPSAVKFYLENLDKEKVAPLEIPLRPSGRDDGRYIFRADRVAIPFSGDWRLDLRILDVHDNETELKKEFTLFKP